MVEQHAISPHKRSAAAGSPHFIALPVRWVSQGCLGVRRGFGRSLVARGQRCHVLRQLLSTFSVAVALSYGMAASQLKHPRYPAGGTRKHGRRNSAPSPKLIQPGSAVSGSAETRLVGKLSASHSQSAYAIYTAAPTAAPYSWNFDCSSKELPGPRDPETPDAKRQGPWQRQDKASSTS